MAFSSTISVLAVVAALTGLILWRVGVMRGRAHLDDALRNLQARADWLGTYYQGLLRDGVANHAVLELPSNGLTVYAAGRMKSNPAVKMLKELKAGGVTKARRAALVETLAGQLIHGLDVVRPDFDTVTSAPPTAANFKRRGYDHVAEIARHVALMSGVRYVALLDKDGAALSQVAVRRRAARLENIRRAITARGSISPLKVLLIDDVTTTGATLEACADALTESGAHSVIAMVLASDRRGV